MRAQSTDDVSIESLEIIAEELSTNFLLEVDRQQFSLRSTDPPSWVTFIADANWWTKIMAAYAAIYVSEIVKEAGKDTWKNHAKFVSQGIAAINTIKRFGISLSNLRKQLPSKTRIEIALPIPEEYFCTRLELAGTDGDELALQTALFVKCLPALNALISDENLNGQTMAGGISLRLLPDGSLHVRWQDNKTLSEHTRTIPLNVKD